MGQKICAGITNDNEIYFFEIELLNKKEQEYNSFTGFAVRAIKETDAIQQVREGLGDGELWRMAVEDERTTLSLNEWIEYILSVDGELSGFDNSLLTDEIEINGTNYLFESGGCGQHQEETLKEYFIPKETFQKINELWKEHHLEKGEIELPKIEKQDMYKLLERAIKTILLN